MRTYEDIINDYLEWHYKKTNNIDLRPEDLLTGTELEINVKKGQVWKQILDLCYQPKDGIYWFWKFVLGDMTYAGYPEPIHFNNLWWKWNKLCQIGDHIVIKCSRQHGKSTFWTVIQSIYRCAMFEHYNVLLESATEDQAIMLLTHMVRIIENNEFLKSKINKGAKWSTTELEYNGGKIVGKGIGSEVRGGTYDYIIIDDILRADNKLKDEDIETFIDEELEPMILVRKGQIVIVGTPKSETDIFNTIQDRIKEGSEWKFFVYPAITNWKKKELLCPDRFTWEQLLKKRSIMGRLKFDKEFMCETYSSGSALFPTELRKHAKELGKQHILYPRFNPKDHEKWYYYMGVDCARAGTAGGDYTVVTVLAYDSKTQIKKICWVWREKGLKISEQVKYIADIAKKFNYPPVLVERNNIGQDFIDILVDEYNLNIEEFTTGASEQKKADLIRFLINAFEHEKIIMPMGNEFTRDIIGELDTELARFVVEITAAGNERMKGSGRSHDDMVMSLALANKCSQTFGFIPFAESIESNRTTELERFAGSGDIIEVLKF